MLSNIAIYWFVGCLIVFYGTSTLVSYLLLNPFYTNILNVHDLLLNSLKVTLFLNKLVLICLNKVKWFQVLLFNTSNSIQGGVLVV